MCHAGGSGARICRLERGKYRILLCRFQEGRLVWGLGFRVESFGIV
jgi:hypothetical protein